MKTISRLISLALVAAAFALPALAQDPAAAPAAQNVCEEQARTDMYTDYYNSKNKKDAAGAPDAAAQPVPTGNKQPPPSDSRPRRVPEDRQ